MKPSVGRVVHYVSYGTPGGEYGQECRAAIVTEYPAVHGVSDQDVGLAAINPTGVFFHRAVRYDAGLAGGTWHWPEREDEP